MNPLVFLDFDGVLHADCVYRASGEIVLRRDGISLFEWAPLLVDALVPHPEVRIVLSTSWVRTLSFAEAKSKLPIELQARVVGATWHSGMKREGIWHMSDPFLFLTRCEQIVSYVARHKVEHWLAIDDDTESWLDAYRDRLVACNSDLGIASPATLAELKEKLVKLVEQPNGG
jgi:hypothetical protein